MKHLLKPTDTSTSKVLKLRSSAYNIVPTREVAMPNPVKMIENGNSAGGIRTAEAARVASKKHETLTAAERERARKTCCTV